MIFFILIDELVNAMHSVVHPEGPLGIFTEIMMFGVANIEWLISWATSMGYFNHVAVVKINRWYNFPMMTFLIFLNFLSSLSRCARKVDANNNLTDMLSSVQRLQQRQLKASRNPMPWKILNHTSPCGNLSM